MYCNKNMSCAACFIQVNLSACGKCLTTLYCSKECQSSHWNTHHRVQCVGRKTFESNQESLSSLSSKQQHQAEEIILGLQKDTLIWESQLKKASEVGDFKKRLDAHQEIYTLTMSTLGDVLTVYGASKSQIKTVQNHFKSSEKMITEFQKAALSETSVDNNILERIHFHQQEAWKSMEILCNVQPATQKEKESAEEKAFAKLNYEIIELAAGMYAESLEWMRSEMLSLYKDQDPTLIEASLWEAFRDYLKEGAMAGTQTVLRELVNCLGWGQTYPFYMRQTEDYEKTHLETKRTFDALRTKSPSGTFDLADRMLYAAERLDDEMTKMASANLSTTERQKVYSRQVWVMKMIAGLAMSAGLGSYLSYGIKSMGQAIKENASALTDFTAARDRLFDQATATSTSLKELKEAKLRFTDELVANKTALTQLMANRQIMLSSEHDAFKLVLDEYLKTHENDNLSEKTRQTLLAANSISKRLHEDRNDPNIKTGTGANAVGFFNSIPPFGRTGELVIKTGDLAPSLRSASNEFFLLAKKISYEHLEKMLPKDVEKFESLQGQRDFYLDEERTFWSNLESYIASTFGKALKNAEIQTSADVTKYSNIVFSAIAARNPAVARETLSEFFKSNDAMQESLTAGIEASNPIIAEIAVNITTFTEQEKEITKRVSHAKKLVTLYEIEEARLKEFNANFPVTPLRAVKTTFSNILFSTLKLATGNVKQFFSMTWPSAESGLAQLFNLKEAVVGNAVNSNATWMEFIDSVSKFTSFIFTMIMIIRFFSTLGLASVAVGAFLVAYLIKRITSWTASSSFDNEYIEPHVRRDHAMDQGQSIHTSAIRHFCGKTGKIFNILSEMIGGGSIMITAVTFIGAIFSDLCRFIELAVRMVTNVGTAFAAGRGNYEQAEISTGPFDFIRDYAYQVYSTASSQFAFSRFELSRIMGSLFVKFCIGIPVLRMGLSEQWFSRYGCWLKALHVVAILEIVPPDFLIYLGQFLAEYYTQMGIAGGLVTGIGALRRYVPNFDMFLAFMTQKIVYGVSWIPMRLLPARPAKSEEETSQFGSDPFAPKRSRSRSRRRK